LYVLEGKVTEMSWKVSRVITLMGHVVVEVEDKWLQLNLANWKGTSGLKMTAQ
jgi:hypothetical protein